MRRFLLGARKNLFCDVPTNEHKLPLLKNVSPMDPRESRQIGGLSFDAVYQDLEDAVYRYCFRLCGGRRAEAEDLAQDTWVQVWRSLHQFEGRGEVRGWIFRIALRQWLARRDAVERIGALHDEAGPGSDPRPATDLRLALEEALGHLPEAQRTALILVKSEGFSHREAAEILGVPQGTVQFRVFSALHRLRKLLAEGGLSLSVFALGRLDRPLREWGQVRAPAGLRERIYERLGDPPPPPGAPSPRPRDRSGARAFRWVPVLAVGSLCAGLGWWGWQGLQRYPAASGTAESRAVRSYLQAMSEVRWVTATGYSEVIGEEGTRERKERVIAWFRSPGLYRARSEQGSGKEHVLNESFRTGTEAVSLGFPGVGRPVRVVFPPETARRQMMLSNVLDPEGELPRRLTARGTRVQGSPAASGGTEYLIDPGRVGSTWRQWKLTVEPGSGRVTRLEALQHAPAARGWRLAARTVLDRFDYDTEVPEAVFRIPPPGVRPALPPGRQSRSHR